MENAGLGADPQDDAQRSSVSSGVNNALTTGNDSEQQFVEETTNGNENEFETEPKLETVADINTLAGQDDFSHDLSNDVTSSETAAEGSPKLTNSEPVSEHEPLAHEPSQINNQMSEQEEQDLLTSQKIHVNSEESETPAEIQEVQPDADQFEPKQDSYKIEPTLSSIDADTQQILPDEENTPQPVPMIVDQETDNMNNFENENAHLELSNHSLQKNDGSLEDPSTASTNSVSRDSNEDSRIQIVATDGDFNMKSATNEDLQSVSAYFSVPTEVLESNRNLFLALLMKLQEFETFKSDNEMLKINYEQSQSSNRRKLELAKEELLKSRTQIKNLEKHQEELENSKLELESSLSSTNASNNRSAKLLADMRLKMKELESSKNNISELLENKQIQLSDVNEENKRLITANKDIKKRMMDMETSKENISSELLKLKFDSSKLEREVKLLTESRNFFENSLKSKIIELDEIRSKKDSEITSLTVELNKAKNNYEVANISLINYTSQISSLSTKNNEYQLEIKNLKDKIETQESQYLETLKKRDEYIQVLEKSNKDKTNRIESLDRLYAETSDKVKLDEAEYRKQFEEFEQKIIEKDVKIEDLDNTVSELSSNSVQLNDESSLHITSLAKNTLKGLDPELSLSDLITEINHLRKDLLKEKRLKTKAESELSAILNEMQRKLPLLTSYKEKCEQFENREKKMNVMIENMSTDKKTLSKNCEILKKKIQDSDFQLKNLTKYKYDLQRQVAILLTEMQCKLSGENPLTAEEKRRISNIVTSYGEIDDVDTNDTGRLITSRLTTFKNTVELIKQNEKLLTVSRRLGDTLEAKESDIGSTLNPIPDGAVAKSKEAILKLQEQVKNLETRLQAAVNSKNMLQEIVDSGSFLKNKTDDIVNNERITMLLEEMNLKKKEIVEIRKSYDSKIFELNSTIQAIIAEKSSISLELAKEKSALELRNEKISSLQSANELYKNDNQQLKSIIDRNQDMMSKLEEKCQSNANKLVSYNELVVEYEVKVKSLTAEKDMWKSTETHLREEINKLYDEKSESNKMLVRLQTLDAERQENFKETIQRFSNNADSLQKEVDSLRVKLEKSNNEVSNILHSKNVDSKIYQQRIDLSNEQITSYKATLESKEKQILNLSDEINSLKSKHAAIDGRKQNLLNSLSTNSSQDVIALKEELANALEDLENATKEATQFRELGIATEQQLSSLNKSYELDKLSAEEKIHKYEEEIEALKKEISELQSERDLLKDETDELSNTYKLSKQEYSLKIDELNSSILTFEQVKEDYEQKLSILKSDLEAKNTKISEFEELIADNSNQISTLETINEIVKKEIEESNCRFTDLEQQVLESKNLLSQEKEKNDDLVKNFEQEVRNDKIRISELEAQNRTLINQLEESPLSFDESDDMKNLVTYLTRENDSLSQQLQYVKSEESILRQSVHMGEKEIASLKAEIVTLEEKTLTIDKYSKDLESMKGEVEELRIYKENNSNLRNQIRIYESQVSDLEAKLSVTSSQLPSLNDEVASLKSNISSREKLIDELKTELSKLKEEVSNNVNDAAADVLSTKDSQIEELQNKYNERTQQIEKLKNQFNEKLIKMRGEKQEAIDSKLLLETKVKELEERTGDKSVTDLTEQSNLQSQISSLNMKLNQQSIESSSTIKAKNETIDKLNAEINTLKKELESLSESVKSSADLAAMEQKFKKEREEAQKRFDEELRSLKSQSIDSKEIEEFKRKLKEDQDKEIEAYKNKIRAPSLAKINEIAEKRIKAKTEELEKSYLEKTKELESRYSNNDNGTSDDFSKEKEALFKKFEADKEQLKKDVRAAVEKEKEFKEKFLQNKLSRLEEEVKKLKSQQSNLALPANGSNVAFGNFPTFGSTPQMPMNFGNSLNPGMFNMNGNSNPFSNTNSHVPFASPNVQKALPSKPQKRPNEESEESDKRPKN